jgi:hypothetical protein
MISGSSLSGVILGLVPRTHGSAFSYNIERAPQKQSALKLIMFFDARRYCTLGPRDKPDKPEDDLAGS